ncbi:MAG: hypothetical protein M3O31_08375 [Acidobacteriota bacterium]|nr:hypothetical protein [Acidobacteriota bacterium]
MPGLRYSILRFLPIPALCVLLCLTAAQARARNPDPAKYPLRVHVLASDETHKTPRMSPAESLVCDGIEGMGDAISPGQGGPISLSGISSDPCSLHPEMMTGRLLNLGEEAPVYSGAGRGDLVSPPVTTEGVSFRYDDCVRMRVRPGFQSLPARWKKTGKKLEVLIPSDEIPVRGRPLPPVRCSLTVTLHDFVYLLLRNGNIVEVSQDLFREKPALRVLLSGRPETIQRRLQEFTVPAHPVR